MLFLDSFNFEQQEQIKKSTLTHGGEEDLQKLLTLESLSYNQVALILDFIGKDNIVEDQIFPLSNLVDAIIDKGPWDLPEVYESNVMHL